MATTFVDTSQSLLDQCNQILKVTEAQKKTERRIRNQAPLVRIWDGEWNLHWQCRTEYEASFDLVDNDTGPGTTVHPFDDEVAQWIHDEFGRIAEGSKANVHITVDYCGIRWGGRLDNRVVEKDADGDVTLTCTWLNDYEDLKWYSLWSNPFLLAAIQFPRVFILPGPAIWVLKTALFFNVLRDQLHLWSIPDDPMDLGSWFNLDQSDWSVVIKPTGFLEDMANGTLWCILTSRWKTWHDAAKDILQDAELSVRARRFLVGDDPPWPGANLRNGALVIDIIDQSGFAIGTSHGGTLFDGLAFTIAGFTNDFLETTFDLLADVAIPDDYYQQNWLSTRKELPYVIYREGAQTGVETSQFIWKSAKAIQINVGGHSMPGVNEAISAGVQATGDILGNLFQIGSIGGSVDTLLKPFYEDTILAWMSIKLASRSSKQGWSRNFEYFQDGADKAYTISSLMVMRAGIFATAESFGHKLTVSDGSPYLIGENGLGHFTIGDRIGATIKGETGGRIYMDRVSKLTLAWTREKAPEWQIYIGDDKALEDPLVKAFARLEGAFAGLHEFGVF